MNLRQIKDKGIIEFVEQQKERIRLLNKFIEEYDDGKSKSFFCLAAALMEIDDLHEVVFRIQEAGEQLKDRKKLAKLARSMIERKAEMKGIELIYRREKA
jgi:hypothetical protein